MNNLIKTIGASALLAVSLGCSDKKVSEAPEVSDYYHRGTFNEHRVKTGVMANRRYIEISKDLRTRGYRPAKLVALDINPEFGFEFEVISFIPGSDLKLGADWESIEPLRKFRDPIELERIFAYINADRLARNQ